MSAINNKGISQTVVAGTLQTPWFYSLLLIANVFLMGCILTKIMDLKSIQEASEMMINLKIDQLNLNLTNKINEIESARLRNEQEQSQVIKELKTEFRLLEMHVQDQNAILIREGLMKPGDKVLGPTSPTMLSSRKP